MSLGHISRCNFFNAVDVYRMPKSVIKHEKLKNRTMNKPSFIGKKKRKTKIVKKTKIIVKIYPKKLNLLKQEFNPLTHAPKMANSFCKTVCMMQTYCQFRFRLGPYELHPDLNWSMLANLWWNTKLDFIKSQDDDEQEPIIFGFYVIRTQKVQYNCYCSLLNKWCCSQLWYCAILWTPKSHKTIFKKMEPYVDNYKKYSVTNEEKWYYVNKKDKSILFAMNIRFNKIH